MKEPPRPEYPPIHTKPERSRAERMQLAATGTSVMTRGLGAPSAKDWYFFALELRTMIQAGVPMISALKMLESSSERYRVKKTAAFVAHGLKEGQGLETAAKGASDLPPLLRALLTLGNRSGTLTHTLDLIVRHYQWILEIRSLILRSIWYPAILVVLGAFIMVGRETAIASLTGRMGTGDAFVRYMNQFFGPIVVGTIAAVIVTTALKHPRFKRGVDAFILTIPGLGGVVKKYAIAIFFEVLAATIEAGMPITAGYQLAANSTPNKQVGDRLARPLHFLQDGESLAETLRQTGVLDADARGMVAAGEASAEAPFLMRKLAEYYNGEVRSQVRMLVVVYTPLMMPLVAIAYFVRADVLGWMAFILVFLFRLL
jgi:type II secretory pathway component PulF